MIISKLLALLIYFHIFLEKNVLANYCEFQTCDETEYCCGDNRCCKKTVDVWYYWAVGFLVVITIIVAVCLYRKELKNQYLHYSLIEQKSDDLTSIT